MALEELARRRLSLSTEAATPTFEKWLPIVSPVYDWEPPHLRMVQAKLRDVTEGRCNRLMLFLPPRHGKSEMTTIRYPVWRMETKPDCRVCVGAYNQEFASRFGRRSRRIAERRLQIASDRSAVQEWETAAGGVYRSCGVGSAPTGEGFDLIAIDDPVRSRAEANSEAYRNRVWEWYTDDMYTRREPGCAIVLIMTRWHTDDLAGRLLEAAKTGGDQWEVVNLPALAEVPDQLGRAEGEALWPARFDAEELQRTRGVVVGFDALYQQRPVAAEGETFKVGKIEVIDAEPAGLRKVRAWDQAATKGDGDYTAGALIGSNGVGLFYVLDVVRGRWSSDERDEQIRQTAALDGRDVAIRGAQDPGSAGVDAAKAFTRMLAGYTVKTERVTGSKESRADAFSSQVNAGNVKMLKGDWNKAFIDELRAFPAGKNDDQVDAASDAFTELAETKQPFFFV